MKKSYLKSVRDRLEIVPGTILEFQSIEDKMGAAKQQQDDVFAKAAWSRQSLGEYLGR